MLNRLRREESGRCLWDRSLGAAFWYAIKSPSLSCSWFIRILLGIYSKFGHRLPKVEFSLAVFAFFYRICHLVPPHVPHPPLAGTLVDDTFKGTGIFKITKLPDFSSVGMGQLLSVGSGSPKIRGLVDCNTGLDQGLIGLQPYKNGSNHLKNTSKRACFISCCS